MRGAGGSPQTPTPIPALSDTRPFGLAYGTGLAGWLVVTARRTTRVCAAILNVALKDVGRNSQAEPPLEYYCCSWSGQASLYFADAHGLPHGRSPDLACVQRLSQQSSPLRAVGETRDRHVQRVLTRKLRTKKHSFAKQDKTTNSVRTCNRQAARFPHLPRCTPRTTNKPTKRGLPLYSTTAVRRTPLTQHKLHLHVKG